MPLFRNTLLLAIATLLTAVSMSGPIGTSPANAYPPGSMGLEFVTSGANEVAQIGFGGDLQGVTIDWGDGTSLQNIPNGSSVADALYSHTYTTAGTYVAVVSATKLEHFGYCGGATNFWNLTRILSWGDLNTTSFKCAAYTRTALTEVPPTLPSTVTDITEMFYDNHVFNQDLSAWNTANVTSMERVFTNAGTFNHSLGAWNITNVTSLDNILNAATGFGDAAYSNTLIGWASQSVTPNLTLGAVSAQATGCNAIEARNTLINVANWTINDTAPTQVCTAQTVTWAPTNTSGQTGTLTPNTLATGSDLGAITYVVSDAGASGCTVNSSSGVITAPSAGTCVVRATSAATPGFFSGSTTVSFAFTAPTLAATGANTVTVLVFALGGIGLGIIVLLVIFIARRRKL